MLNDLSIKTKKGLDVVKKLRAAVNCLYLVRNAL